MTVKKGQPAKWETWWLIIYNYTFTFIRPCFLQTYVLNRGSVQNSEWFPTHTRVLLHSIHTPNTVIFMEMDLGCADRSDGRNNIQLHLVKLKNALRVIIFLQFRLFKFCRFYMKSYHIFYRNISISKVF